MDQQWWSADRFADRVGERFELTSLDEGPAYVELVEVTESAELGGTGPEGRQRHQFSLVFRGGPSVALPQATYGLRHADLGDLELFLVPLGPDGVAMRYEAAFA